MNALTPTELRQLIVAVSQRLDAAGLAAAGQLLRERGCAAYTTSSEWLGEVGRTVQEIAAQYRLPKQVVADLEPIIEHVRQVWPGFKTAAALLRRPH